MPALRLGSASTPPIGGGSSCPATTRVECTWSLCQHLQHLPRARPSNECSPPLVCSLHPRRAVFAYSGGGGGGRSSSSSLSSSLGSSHTAAAVLAASLTARAAQWHCRRHSRRGRRQRCWRSSGADSTLTRGAGGAAAAASVMRVFVCVCRCGRRRWQQPPGGAQSGPDRSLAVEHRCCLCVLVSGRA